MDKKARFMEAVAEKVGKRKPMMRRKGMESPSGMPRKPGMAVMIAIGGPKRPPMEDEMEDKMDEKAEMKGEKMGKAEKIAMLQEKIASLKAELALLEDEDEEMDENEMEDEQEYEDEDEDED